MELLSLRWNWRISLSSPMETTCRTFPSEVSMMGLSPACAASNGGRVSDSVDKPAAATPPALTSAVNGASFVATLGNGAWGTVTGTNLQVPRPTRGIRRSGQSAAHQCGRGYSNRRWKACGRVLRLANANQFHDSQLRDNRLWDHGRGSYQFVGNCESERQDPGLFAWLVRILNGRKKLRRGNSRRWSHDREDCWCAPRQTRRNHHSVRNWIWAYQP